MESTQWVYVIRKPNYGMSVYQRSVTEGMPTQSRSIDRFTGLYVMSVMTHFGQIPMLTYFESHGE